MRLCRNFRSQKDIMFSLKENFQPVSNAQRVSSICRLHNLPSELLDQIISILGYDERRAEVLRPVSLVSRRLRNLAQALLFRSVKVVLSQCFQRRGEAFTVWLLCNPRIQNYIEHVEICAPLPSMPDEDILESVRLTKALPMLSKLESLRLHALNDVTLPLLQALTSCARPLHLAIANVRVCYVPGNTYMIRFGQPELLTNLERCASVSISFSHGPQSPVDDARRSGSLVSLRSVLAKTRGIKAIQIIDTNGDHFPPVQDMMPTYVSDLINEIAVDTAWNGLEEFHVDIKHFLAPETVVPGDTAFWLQQDVWGNLRRLSVGGRGCVFGSFFRHAASLSNLMSLRLSCTALTDHLTEVQETPDSPLLHLSKLRELELELVHSQIRIDYFANPHLRKLKIHAVEKMFRNPMGPCVKLERTPEEIASLLKLCPLLQHVEVDVGDMSNLWNGHAVAGIDVRVSVYNVLASLARLPRLQKLRLFPPYCKRGSNTDFQATLYHQPLSDEQAIKVFNYLKNLCPTLQEVAISTDNKLASQARYRDFHAMSWTMHTLGSQTILVTRQGLRDYEQRQTWVGERQLTTEIRRFSYLKPHLPDFAEWILPTSTRPPYQR